MTPAVADAVEHDRAGDDPVPRGVALADFHAYLPSHTYIFAPSREMWPGASVNARVRPIPTGKMNKKGEEIFIAASYWLDEHQSCEQMTWAPGEPMLIRDRLVADGWIPRAGCTTFNLYREPPITLGDPAHATPWIDHVHQVYPDDVDHILDWLSHRRQRPQDKLNHVLVLGGLQGIGKDTILEPVKYAVGPWNFVDISPTHLLGRFNGFTKSVILRINEAHDLGDIDRFALYDRLKVYAAAPPDVIRVDEKNLREHTVWNVCGVIITSNHRTDGLYLPADDRRHYVCWSPRTKDDFGADYWADLYAWYASGGDQHVAAYLATRDLSHFDPKAPPLKTPAFWDIVDASRAPEDAEIADAIDRLKSPAALTLTDLAGPAPSAFAYWLTDRKNARQIPHRLEEAGYVAIRNPTAKDGRWRLHNRRQVIYVRQDLTRRDQLAVATELCS